MGKFITKFETTAAYDAAKDGLVRPNVSYIVEDNTVEYKPTLPFNIIMYTASAKLPETRSEYESGLHTKAFSGASGQLTITSHTFDNGVGIIEFNGDITSIGKAFYECTSLTSIDIPDSVTKIGGAAFRYCRSLTSIEIPDSVTSIGNYAFASCSGLTSVTIPDSVTSISEGAFASCSSLTSCTIGNSVTSIGNYAFNGCSGLTSIVIPNSVTSIDSYVFSGCSSLTSCTIGDGVTSIGHQVFRNCSSLTSIEIPSGVTSIGGNAFNNCSSLTRITSLATTAPSISNTTFQNVKTGGTLTVPNGSSGYDVWMGTGDYYLGKYNWTKVEQ